MAGWRTPTDLGAAAGVARGRVAVKVRRIDFSPDEWLSGCRRLDNAARGMYITACALIYSIGGPIEREELRAACREHGNAFNRQLAVLIRLGKLDENDGKLMNKRCGNELEKAQKRAENWSENLAKARENKETQHTIAARAPANHQPSTNKDKNLKLVEGDVAAREARGVGNGHATASPGNRLARWQQLMTEYIYQRLPAEDATSLLTAWIEQQPDAIARVNALNVERKARKHH